MEYHTTTKVQLPSRNAGVECRAFRRGHVPERHTFFCGGRVPKRPNLTAWREANNLSNRYSMTLHFPYHGDKMSRLASRLN
jgi:hypothetical protein